jgi:hypothetical protein
MVKQVLGKKSHDQAGNHPQTQMERIELSRKDDPIQEKKQKYDYGIHERNDMLLRQVYREKEIFEIGQP